MRGLVAAGLVAWALMTAGDLLPLLAAAPAGGMNRIAFGRLLLLYAVVGIPVALAVTLLAGGIAWLWAARRGAASARAAVRAGATTGAVLGTISLAFTLASNTGGSLYLRRYGIDMVRDGMLTAAGWALELAEFGGTVLVGAVAGWVAWRVARPRPG